MPINKWIAIDVFRCEYNKRKNCSLTLCQYHELNECVIKYDCFVGLNGYLRGRQNNAVSMTERYHQNIRHSIHGKTISRLFYSVIDIV